MRNKIKNLIELKKIVTNLRKRSKTIVFTNGCFDLLHLGHVRYLNEAKKYGDILIVGVNSDCSVRSLKGEERPIIGENDRVEMLASLEMVDYVIMFTELRVTKLLNELKPEIFVKGGDYTLDTIPECPVVNEYGGIIKLVSEIKGRSSSDIIKKIKGLTK